MIQRTLRSRDFLLLYLPLLGLAGLALWGYGLQGYRGEVAELKANLRSHVEMGKDIIQMNLLPVYEDLVTIANSATIDQLGDHRTFANRAAVIRAFTSWSRHKQLYDQIRYIDDSGQEVVRVNYHRRTPIPVPDGQLQNKAGRYYFQDAIKLERRQIYVSPLDLNVERGAVERPLKPMIRVATPAFDSADHKRGIVVLNYSAHHLIEAFKRYMGPDKQQTMLLNAEGYWLTAHDPNDEWGFMLDHGRGFAARDPAAWRWISLQRSGSYDGDQGIYLFDTVYPLGTEDPADGGFSLGALTSHVDPQRYFWKVVKFIPHAEVRTIIQRWRDTVLLGLLVAALLLAPLPWFITDANRKRKYAEFHSHLLLESAHEGVFGLDLAGNLTFINPAATHQLGFSAEELMHRNIHALIHHSDADGRHIAPTECRMMHSFTDGATHHVSDEVLWRKDGRSFPVEYRSTPIRWGGEIVGAVVTFHDISERKRSEKALLAAKRRAEKADQAKSDFLAAMSHDIRTPLNVILGMEEVLGETDLNDEQRDFLRLMSGAGETLQALINDILDISKIEAGQLALEEVAFDPAELARTTAAIMAHKAADKGVALKVSLDPALPGARYGDPQRIRQILLNLVGNAVKFTDRGSIELALEPRGNDHLLFRVRDSGIGIPKEKLGEIFKPFSQADHSTTRRFGGTGLGLTICRRLVELMAGSIDVESAEGRGSTFHFTLPLPPAEGVPPVHLNHDHAADDQTPRPAKSERVNGRRILLVDDSRDNRRLIHAYLKRSPHQITEAADGVEAVSRFTRDRFDLILMDLQMPEMDGYAASREIRRHEQRAGQPRTPLVALTAHAMEGDLQRAFEAGCDHYLTKPIAKGRLLEAIEQWARRGTPASSANPREEALTS